MLLTVPEVSRYTCATVTDGDGKVSYEIYDPEGTFLACVPEFEHVEALLRHLNCFINRVGTVH